MFKPAFKKDPALINKGLEYLSFYPEKELYRLFVDGRLLKEECGWLRYEEREKGAMEALFNALSFVKNSLNNEISCNLIKELHKICTTKVHDLGNLTPGTYRGKSKNLTYFGIPPERATVQGIKELLLWIANTNHYCMFGGVSNPSFPVSVEMFGFKQDFSTWLLSLDEKALDEEAKKIYGDMQQKDGQGNLLNTYCYIAPSAEIIEEKMQAFTDQYLKEIYIAPSEKEKKRIILGLVQNCERLHPFPDANGRTFVNLLLNMLLMQNGFPPATFYEPNVFDAYSVDDLLIKLDEALENTKKLIAGEKDLFGFNSDTIPKDKQQILADYINKMSAKKQGLE